MIAKLDSIATLRRAGIAQPVRLVDLMRKTITFLELDLSGLTVLTEAASGPYVVTPLIAALAGAQRVLALTRDSNYASADAVKVQTQALEALCSLKGRVEIYAERFPGLFAQADIITNLGFVRPIDDQMVDAMKPGAVVPLMCEAWEFRPGDVDLEACRRKGILVVGTNEDFPGLETFTYSGLLCLKMLFDAQIEVHKSQILVVSSDKFGVVIEQRLVQSGAVVRRINTLRALSPEDMTGIDAVIVADYTRHDVVIGSEGDITAEAFAQLAPTAAVLQFAGRVDAKGLVAQGVHVYPQIELGPHRMAQTLASLGPRPVVELHTAGLKVGELVHKSGGREHFDSLNDSQYRALCLPIT